MKSQHIKTCEMQLKQYLREMYYTRKKKRSRINDLKFPPGYTRKRRENETQSEEKEENNKE